MTKDKRISELESQVGRLLAEAETSQNELEELQDMAYRENERPYGEKLEKVWYRDLFNTSEGRVQTLLDEKHNLTKIIQTLINPEILKQDAKNTDKTFIG